MEALRLFSNVTSENPEALSVCDRHLEDSNPDVRCYAALGIVRAGDKRPKVLASLARFKNSEAHAEPFVQEYLDSNRETWLRLELWLMESDASRLREVQARGARRGDELAFFSAPLQMKGDTQLYFDLNQESRFAALMRALNFPPTVSIEQRASWDRVLLRQALTDSDGVLLYELLREKKDEDWNDALLFNCLVWIIERQPTA
jgi:hypothetical protein